VANDQDRFRVTVSAADRTAMRGWWSDQGVARDKFRDWTGSHGNLAQPRVTLTDETKGTPLTNWPEAP
jgi:hypothetical protein